MYMYYCIVILDIYTDIVETFFAFFLRILINLLCLVKQYQISLHSFVTALC